MLQSKKITQVACGSAHTLAWSTNKPVSASRLPVSTPLEYDLVRDLQLPTLRNRLVLLHHFSELFCPGVAMFPIDGEGSLDKLRGILVSSTKEATFRKVSIHCLKINQYPASIMFVCPGNMFWDYEIKGEMCGSCCKLRGECKHTQGFGWRHEGMRPL